MAFSGENAESYFDDGLTACMKGDMRQAIACFEKSIHLNPSFLVARQQLAKCYLRAGHGAQAVKLLKEIVARTPGHAPYRLDLGHAYLSVGETEEARRQFEQLAVLDPGNARAHLGLARVSFAEGKWQSAQLQAQQARDSGGPNFGVLFLLGRAAQLAGDPIQAEKCLEQADKLMEQTVELQSTKPTGHFFRGEVAFVQNKFSTALEYYRAAEDLAAQDRVYTAFGEYFSLLDILAKQGLCYQRLGKPDRAKKLGDQIIEIDPNHPIGQALAKLE